MSLCKAPKKASPHLNKQDRYSFKGQPELKPSKRCHVNTVIACSWACKAIACTFSSRDPSFSFPKPRAQQCWFFFWSYVLSHSCLIIVNGTMAPLLQLQFAVYSSFSQWQFIRHNMSRVLKGQHKRQSRPQLGISLISRLLRGIWDNRELSTQGAHQQV